MSTRATIRTAAQTRADQDSSDFPTTAQWNQFLDDAGKEVWFDLIRAGWPINFSSKTITASGLTFYPLSVSGTVMTVVGVYFLQGADFYPLHRVNEGKRAALRSSSYQPSGFAGFYDLRIDTVSGPGVEFLPKPLSGTYQVDYTLEWPGFSGDSDVWPGPARSDQLVGLRAAEYAVKKEGQARAAEAAGLRAEYNELMRSVQDMASWFDQRNPAQIRDVNSEQGRYSFDYPLAGPDPVGY